MGPVLVFDGDCGICTTLANWTRPRLQGAEVIAWQFIDDLGRYGLSQADVTTAVYWVAPDGSTHRGHLGVARTLMAMGGLWWLLGACILVPPIRWLAAVVYVVIAKNRERLPGATAACKVPDR